jgi:dTDP-4-dehydrorhamnose reductase
MIKDIYNDIWNLSKVTRTPFVNQQLLIHTQELIEIYEAQGRLEGNPFDSARHRLLSLPKKLINEELKGSTCIVTGGLGCIGSVLVSQLLKFEVSRIVILDKTESVRFKTSRSVISLICDIRDSVRLDYIFDNYRPDFVFHAAAQRDPGYAETHIEETISTNVLGTLNVLLASEKIGTVKQVIVSSTGKASRYFTKEVYAATKKMGEFLVERYARASKIKYALVRFTHILDNSLMDMDLRNSAHTSDEVSVHSPGKFITAQNAREAAHLMLNALIQTRPNQCVFLLVRHLEWPIESLAAALYYVKQSGRKIPVVFKGNPPGYSEKFFRGQFDWSRPGDLNLLINVFERGDRVLNTAGDIIISVPCTTQANVLDCAIGQLKDETYERDEPTLKAILHDTLEQVVRSSLTMVDHADTLDILRWGLDPHFLELENTTAEDFGRLVPLLRESLGSDGGKLNTEEINYSLNNSYVDHRTVRTA